MDKIEKFFGLVKGMKLEGRAYDEESCAEVVQQASKLSNELDSLLNDIFEFQLPDTKEPSYLWGAIREVKEWGKGIAIPDSAIVYYSKLSTAVYAVESHSLAVLQGTDSPLYGSYDRSTPLRSLCACYSIARAKGIVYPVKAVDLLAYEQDIKLISRKFSQLSIPKEVASPSWAYGLAMYLRTARPAWKGEGLVSLLSLKIVVLDHVARCAVDGIDAWGGGVK
jgi:hypothetical protein